LIHIEISNPELIRIRNPGKEDLITLEYSLLCKGVSVAEPLHFYAALGKIFDAAPAP
jgi:hypothetical protein